MSKVNELTFNLGGKTFNLSKADFENAKKNIEGKEVNMAMTVDASANYQTNATEYFRRAMIGE
jgi:hypothetical protein